MKAPPVPERAFLVAFGALPMVGPARLTGLLAGRTPSRAWSRLVDGSLFGEVLEQSLPGVTSELLARWQADARCTDVQALWQQYQSRDVDVLVLGDDLWPPELLDDPDPPAILFGAGPLTEPSHPAVAIVGTRRCSSYGRSIAAELGRALAERKVTVVSGLANGIDSVAQRSALDAGGEVIGVVGSGIDVVYPASNRRLWNDIVHTGRLWSETPLGVRPARWRFPARNRIIAALADVVVVVESPAKGGSLHTVDSALERDKVVMAVPGPINANTSVGTNRLLIQGCEPVTGVEDILAALGLCVAPTAEEEPTVAMLREPAAGPERAVIDAIGFGACSIDHIILASAIGPIEVLEILGRLEAGGFVRETAGWWERT